MILCVVALTGALNLSFTYKRLQKLEIDQMHIFDPSNTTTKYSGGNFCKKRPLSFRQHLVSLTQDTRHMSVTATTGPKLSRYRFL